MKRSRKRFWGVSIFLTCMLLGYFVGRPLYHLWKVKVQEDFLTEQNNTGYVNDVSGLNKTPVDSIVKVTSGGYEEAVAQLSDLLQYAREHHLSVSIAGAKHSMGGHTIAPNGIQVDMRPFCSMTLDPNTHILTVGSGALWSEVIPFLDKSNRAVFVMQSDNAFTVGGSISVNCHGWQHNVSPIASTVVSFRLMLASGKVLTCSRQENKELFSLVLGGYGLFGIVLDVCILTVPNEVYTYHTMLMLSEKYTNYYSTLIDPNKKVRMVYGRLNVNHDRFLEKVILNYFIYDSTQIAAPLAPSPEASSFTDLKTKIFIGSKGNDYGKKLRWNAEWATGRANVGSTFTSNEIMNESPALYLNKDTGRTDILHEYFIPRRNFYAFIQRLKTIVPTHPSCDLLNVTLRNVYEDKDVFLRYAKEEMFGFVMFFNQETTTKANKEMQALTHELIEAALELEGAYYLPYRLHASKEQFHRVYPMAVNFFQKKLEYDSLVLFQNKFYQEYK